ncbi:IS4 family transposase [Halorubrum sp. CBA1125]|uniref:IS4 family transposase n=1 Tax=Halorubrum sp. CBA1125 TaxID=2668072 RepID=UPI0012E926C6|nr:IS4 family transposase [Halorubrum sp. CBA1125]MUW16017.1 IS4 family transposase [Halorubrum sp. CBA1125]
MQSGSRSRRTDLDEEELCQTDVSGKVRKEFQSAEFGDKRLTDRLMQVGDRLGRAPAESIPNACEDWASAKATYRFCDNERVDPNEILGAHKRAQRSRVRDKNKLLVVSDTTELVFPRHPSKEGLGDIGNSKTDLEGVKVHTTIGLDPQTHHMTGIIDQQSLIEDQQASTKHDANGKSEPIELGSEQEKWIRGDRQASRWLAEEVRPIFIHDRGADSFAFYREVTDDLDAGFVVRANQNRCIQTPSGTDGRLIDWSEEIPEQGRTSIEIEQGSGRAAREAELTVKAGSCELLPPQNDPTHTEPVAVNVVRIDEVREQDDPIQWVLLTTESVAEFSDSLSVVESYRARWTIEDWHKVLKTGCRIEERRLETWERMEVLLSVYSVIAWKVLELRELAREDIHRSPEALLSETERSILETKFPELTDNEAQAYAIAVAKVGGYLDRSSDPPPGWEIMWKGLKKLQTWAEGYELHS